MLEECKAECGVMVWWVKSKYSGWIVLQLKGRFTQIIKKKYIFSHLPLMVSSHVAIYWIMNFGSDMHVHPGMNCNNIP